LSNFVLEYPYNKDWKRGYLVVNGENRKTVILFNNSKDRSSTSYARYLVSVSLGRYLKKEEHVDHKDDDKTNDELENLQILTLLENNRKEFKRRGRLLVKIVCPCCMISFSRRKGNSPLVKCNENRLFCCSRKCSSKMNNISTKQRKELILKQKEQVILFKSHE